MKRGHTFFGVLILGWFLTLFPQSIQAQEFRPLTTRDILSLASRAHLPAFRDIKQNGFDNPASTRSDNTTSQQKSVIENRFNNRVDGKVEQFGYNEFTGKKRSPSKQDLSLVDDNYFLGNGDYLRIKFYGARQDSKQYRVTKTGMVLIDGFPPLSVKDKTLGDFKSILSDIIQEQDIKNRVSVTLTETRKINVMVLGEVDKPGVYHLSPFDDITVALQQAGGIKKTGSLRKVHLLRGKEQIPLDMYPELLSDTAAEEIRLQDGDRLMVPVIGSTIAVAGDVKQTGIFETARGRENYSLDDLMALTGGTNNDSSSRLIKLSLDEKGNELISFIEKDQHYVFKDGDILMVQTKARKQTGSVNLVGPVKQNGNHPLFAASTLSGLLPSKDMLKDTAYPLIGFIKRFNPQSMSEEWIDFSPKRVLEGSEDRPLKNNDTVVLFTREEIQNLEKNIWRLSINENSGDIDPTILNNMEPAASKLTRRKRHLDTEQIGVTDINPNGDKEFPPPPSSDSILHTMFSADKNKTIMTLLFERAIRVKGNVKHTGFYPVSGRSSLADIIEVAGGLGPNADRKTIEVTLAPPSAQTAAPVPITPAAAQARTQDIEQPESMDSRIILDFTMTGEDALWLNPRDTVHVNKSVIPPTAPSSPSSDI